MVSASSGEPVAHMPQWAVCITESSERLSSVNLDYTQSGKDDDILLSS